MDNQAILIKDETRSAACIQSARLWESSLTNPNLSHNYLEVCFKFLKLHQIIRLYVVPTPNKLIKRILL